MCFMNSEITRESEIIKKYRTLAGNSLVIGIGRIPATTTEEHQPSPGTSNCSPPWEQGALDAILAVDLQAYRTGANSPAVAFLLVFAQFIVIALYEDLFLVNGGGYLA